MDQDDEKKPFPRLHSSCVNLVSDSVSDDAIDTSATTEEFPTPSVPPRSMPLLDLTASVVAAAAALLSSEPEDSSMASSSSEAGDPPESSVARGEGVVPMLVNEHMQLLPHAYVDAVTISIPQNEQRQGRPIYFIRILLELRQETGAGPMG